MKKTGRIGATLILFAGVGYGLCFGQGVHVHSATNFLNPTNATTIAATFGGVSVAGNLIVVHVSYSGQTINVTGIADSKANVYTKINGPTNWSGANFRSELWYAFNINGGVGAITVTVTLSAQPVNAGGLKFSQIYISEFSGIKTTNPLDVKSVNAGAAAGAGAFNSGSATTNYTNEMVYGAAIGGTMAAINVGAGFTSVSTANGNLVEFRNVVPAGANNAVFNGTSAGTFVADMATFITTVSVLPITLMSFDAELQADGAVKLDWVTATEINNDYFEVQRSKDGQEWGYIKKIPGAGNSKETLHYTAMDTLPGGGVNYYRLRQVDYDGNHEYSGIRRVDLSSAGKSAIRFYPNPVIDWLHIDAPNEELENISIVNVLGANVYDKISEIVRGDSGIRLNVSNLPAGMYVVRIGKREIRFYKEK